MVHTKQNNLIITVLIINIKTTLHIIIGDNNQSFLKLSLILSK